MGRGREVLSRKIGYPLFALTGFLLVFFTVSEGDLARQGNILWTGGYLLKLVGESAAVGIPVGSLLCYFLYMLAEGKGAKISGRSSLGEGKPEGAVPGAVRRARGWLKRLGPRKVFPVAFVLIAASWIPAYLAYYPAICAYDAPVQVGQAVEDYLIDHHPLVHTLIIRGFLNLGKAVFGDINAGVGLYAAVQLLFLAVCFAWGIAALSRLEVGPQWQVLILLYCMIYPFHHYMAVSMTKDTVFTGFVVLMATGLCLMISEGLGHAGVGGRDALLFVGTAGVVIFRNNGKYALLVLLFFLFAVLIFDRWERPLWRRLLCNVLGAFILGNVVLSAVFRLSGAQQGDRREMLCLPIQQMARCMVYHGGIGMLPEDDGAMKDEDRGLIDNFLLDEGYREYDPYFADPVKAHTNTYVARYRTRDFLSTYWHLLTQFPGDMVNAGLAVNAGYLSPADVTHSQINQEEGRKGRGYVQTYWFEQDLVPRGIHKASKWEGLYGRMESWADRNAYLDLPILKYIFVPGSYLYLYLLLAGWRLIKRDFRLLIPLAFVLGYYITLFLGPTVQMRYLYPVMAALPFLAAAREAAPVKRA